MPPSAVPAACAAIATLCLPAAAWATTGSAPHLDGAELGLAWVVPFAAILLSVAILPLTSPSFWHHHFGKVAAFWALLFLVPFAWRFGPRLALYELMHTLLLEYVPFIILLLALFTVAGGVRLKGALLGSPAVNTGILLVGTVIASWMGTTGAAMLLIRPLIRANAWRRHQVHTVVFFIFLVANIGGSLTPLGDPPLFLGFLQGVSFVWPAMHLLGPMLMCVVVLLAAYYVLDSLYYRREVKPDRAALPQADEPLGIEGKVNLPLLAAIVGAVLLSGVWTPGVRFTVFHVELALQNLVRDALLLGIAAASWRLTSRESRSANDFGWEPIIEVAKLFAGIFLTIIPAIAILRAGTEGALAPIVGAVNVEGRPVDAMYFWAAGILSSFLDNAPTYLVFFNAAGGDSRTLMTDYAGTLTAISAGSVFMGANTYIGNAPNFMVRAIAESWGVRMPSFFGYMLWSGGILLPVFALVTVVFF